MTPPAPPPDPWSSFLDWLQSLIVPDWDAVINLMPILFLLGVVGPILTLIALMWVWYYLHRRVGKVRFDEVEPVPAEIGEYGVPIFPVNVPFCETHAVSHPGTARKCEVDGVELSVRCPVDDTVRGASQQLCRACGTRYVLGASQAPMVVRQTGRPPEGGSAVA